MLSPAQSLDDKVDYSMIISHKAGVNIAFPTKDVDSIYFTKDFSNIETVIPFSDIWKEKKLRTKEKFAVWIDDDGDMGGIDRIKKICDIYGIKCSIAIIASNLNNTDYLNYCRNLQFQGFDIVCHSCSHGNYYTPSHPDYNTDSINKDIALSYSIMKRSGFNTKVFVYPGGGGCDYMTRMILSQYFDYGFVARATDGSIDINSEYFLYGYDSYYEKRYYRHRWFLDKDIDNAFKLYVAKCEEIGRFPVIATHSSTKMSFWDEEYTKVCIEYLKERGYSFITATQAMKYFEPIILAVEFDYTGHVVNHINFL